MSSCRSQAEAEGLTLLEADNKTGYFGVCHNPQASKSKPYRAQMRRDGELVRMGYFATAEEAALCIARSPEGRGTGHAVRMGRAYHEFVQQIYPELWKEAHANGYNGSWVSSMAIAAWSKEFEHLERLRPDGELSLESLEGEEGEEGEEEGEVRERRFNRTLLLT